MVEQSYTVVVPVLRERSEVLKEFKVETAAGKKVKEDEFLKLVKESKGKTKVLVLDPDVSIPPMEREMLNPKVYILHRKSLPPVSAVADYSFPIDGPVDDLDGDAEVDLFDAPPPRYAPPPTSLPTPASAAFPLPSVAAPTAPTPFSPVSVYSLTVDAAEEETSSSSDSSDG